MDQIYADLTLENPLRPDAAPVAVRAVADSGEVVSCAPEAVAVRLGLDLEGAQRRPLVMADGRVIEVAYAGPVGFRFGNRMSIGGVLVVGHDVLLGSLQTLGMDLVLLPQERRLDVNPDHPNRAVVKIK